MPTDILDAIELAVHAALPAHGPCGLDELAVLAGVSAAPAAPVTSNNSAWRLVALDGTRSVTLARERR